MTDNKTRAREIAESPAIKRELSNGIIQKSLTDKIEAALDAAIREERERCFREARNTIVGMFPDNDGLLCIHRVAKAICPNTHE